ncbi:SH2 domain-containing protein 4A-like [Ctenocephalides felis]|uniref:SH2 domain-containing protein 4A-like n=1 Tax=Ctenocephalides felis TaxID=7515 RepID=UPI000E6E1D8A|nr:SH2 domain-containing protein 4A-like [Ctenocephalides felis]
MLQQILRDMHVDPEILAELDDTQKQTLFCRMREEQVRRWRIREEQEAKLLACGGALKKERKPSKRGKNVSFLKGEDGEPWVWVMGEHPNDPSIEEILEAEARETARRQAEQEAQQLRHTVEAELGELLMRCDLAAEQSKAKESLNPERIEDSMEIYCSVDELRAKAPPQKISAVEQKQVEMNNRYNWIQSNNINNGQINNTPPKNNVKSGNFAFHSDSKIDVLQELTLNKPHRVAQRVAMWERRVIGERTSEIFKNLQKKQAETAKEAEEAAQRQEQLWREQERKAKEAETQIREIARRAREQHRRSATSIPQQQHGGNTISATASNTTTSITGSSGPSSSTSSPPGSLEAGMPRPPSARAVLDWYRETEVRRNAGIERDGRVSSWFHGLITRQEAEQALNVEKMGTFLVRLSERIWGYAISYKAEDRIKHYLVDASNGHYQFLGDNQLSHKTLGDLVSHHASEPITMIGGELLKRPCPLPRKILPKIASS